MAIWSIELITWFVVNPHVNINTTMVDFDKREKCLKAKSKFHRQVVRFNWLALLVKVIKMPYNDFRGKEDNPFARPNYDFIINKIR